MVRVEEPKACLDAKFATVVDGAETVMRWRKSEDWTKLGEAQNLCESC